MKKCLFWHSNKFGLRLNSIESVHIIMYTAFLDSPTASSAFVCSEIRQLLASADPLPCNGPNFFTATPFSRFPVTFCPEDSPIGIMPPLDEARVEALAVSSSNGEVWLEALMGSRGSDHSRCLSSPRTTDAKIPTYFHKRDIQTSMLIFQHTQCNGTLWIHLWQASCCNYTMQW